MIDPKTGERRPARTYEIRLDPGSRDRPKSFHDIEAGRPVGLFGLPRQRTREELHAEADEIVERMIRRGVLAP